MKKLLHERLREYGSNCLADYTEWSRQRHANELADEIEKFYIPRPRFEDCEPVQFGDELPTPDKYATKEITRICYTPKGYYFNSSKSANGKRKNKQNGRFSYGELVKRPTPKVLDADGVEIKVGDTVWSLNDSTKWKVTETHPTEPRISLRQLDTEKEVVGGWFLSSEYSLREPDSLEKLRDDMMTEDKTRGISCVQGWVHRLTAIMERDV